MAQEALTADTGAIVPSLVRWHPLHGPAAELLRGTRRVPAQALAQSFSLLTRLPAPYTLQAAQAHAVLLHAFPDEPISLDAAGLLEALQRLARAGLGGGRVYDALVAASAARAGLKLVSADRRALPRHALVGCEAQLLA